MLSNELQTVIGVMLWCVIVVRTVTATTTPTTTIPIPTTLAATIVDTALKSSPKTTTSLLPLQPPLKVKTTTTTSVFGNLSDDGEHATSVNSDNNANKQLSDVIEKISTANNFKFKPSESPADSSRKRSHINEPGYLHFEVEETKDSAAKETSKAETVKEVLLNLFPKGFSDIFRFSYAAEPQANTKATPSGAAARAKQQPKTQSANVREEKEIPFKSKARSQADRGSNSFQNSQKETQELELKLTQNPPKNNHYAQSDSSLPQTSTTASETSKTYRREPQNLYSPTLPNNFTQKTDPDFQNRKPQPFQYPEMLPQNINTSSGMHHFQPTEQPKNHNPPNSSPFNMATEVLKSEIVPPQRVHNYTLYSRDSNISKEYRRQLSPGHMEIVIEKVHYPKESGTEYQDGLNTISKETLLRINRAAEHASVLPSLLLEPAQENATAEETILSMNGPIVILKDNSAELDDDAEQTTEEDNVIAESQYVSHSTYQSLPRDYKIGSAERNEEIPSAEDAIQKTPDVDSTSRPPPLFSPDSDLPTANEVYARKRQAYVPRDLDHFQEHAERSFDRRNNVQEAPSRKFLKNFNPAFTNGGKVPVYKGGFHYEINAPATPLLPKDSVQRPRPQTDYSLNSVQPAAQIMYQNEQRNPLAPEKSSSNIQQMKPKAASSPYRIQQVQKTATPRDFSYQYFTASSVTPQKMFFVTVPPSTQAAQEYQTPHEYVSQAAASLKAHRVPRPTPADSYTFVEVQKSFNLHNRLIKEQDGQLLEQQETTYYRPQFAKDLTAAATPSSTEPPQYLSLATHPINVQQLETGYEQQGPAQGPTAPSQNAEIKVLVMPQGHLYTQQGPRAPFTLQNVGSNKMLMPQGSSYNNQQGQGAPAPKAEVAMSPQGSSYNQQGQGLGSYADQKAEMAMPQGNFYNQQGSKTPFSAQKAEKQGMAMPPQVNFYNQQKGTEMKATVMAQGNFYNQQGPKAPFAAQNGGIKGMLMPQGNAYNQQGQGFPAQKAEMKEMVMPPSNSFHQLIQEEEEVHGPSGLPLQQILLQESASTKEAGSNIEASHQNLNHIIEDHGPEQQPIVAEIIEQPLSVERYIDRPYPVPEIVEKHIPMPYPVIEQVGVPIHIDRYIDRPYPVETIVEKPIPYPIETVVEKVVEKHVPIEVQKVVERPVEKIVEKIVDRPIPVPIRVPVGIPVPMHGHYYALAQPYPPHQPHPNALSWPGQYGSSSLQYASSGVINLPEKVLKNYYARMLKKLHPRLNSAQKAAFTAGSSIVTGIPASRPSSPLLLATKPPVKIRDIRFDLKPPPPSSASWNQGARYVYNTLPSDLTAASAASGPAAETSDHQTGHHDEFLRWRNGHSLKRSPDFGRNLRVEYGFKPPLVPSVEIDDQGIPLNSAALKTADD